MKEFFNITPENHDKAIKKFSGKLYIIYYSTNCIFCKKAIIDLINMPENTLFTYAVCQVDDANDFRLKENLLSLPAFRVYEDGTLIIEKNGYDRIYGVNDAMQSSIEKSKNYHIVYADNAATTKMSKEALEAYIKCAKEDYGNPSTNYALGQKANRILTISRNEICRAINAIDNKIIFTSGGSESDNMALYSAYQEGIRKKKKHIITSSIEHHAVLHTLEKYKKNGFDITVLPVNKKGLINITEFKKAIRSDTILASIMFANNEIGTIQPIKKIGDICKKNDILFHCDAVQAVGHIDIDLSKLHIDYLSLAAHKFNGPKGVGALVVSKNAPISSLILGGGQENGQRAGTENVQSIYAMAIALHQHISKLKVNEQKLFKMTNKIINEMQKLDGVKFNGDIKKRLPGTINMSFTGIGGRELLFLLNAKYGLYVSGGSACNTNNIKPSHVLTAIGLSDTLAESAIRISLNQDNTMDDVRYIIKALKESVNYLRKSSKKGLKLDIYKKNLK